jgi:hypothetical protein
MDSILAKLSTLPQLIGCLMEVINFIISDSLRRYLSTNVVYYRLSGRTLSHSRTRLCDQFSAFTIHVVESCRRLQRIWTTKVRCPPMMMLMTVLFTFTDGHLLLQHRLAQEVLGVVDEELNFRATVVGTVLGDDSKIFTQSPNDFSSMDATVSVF